MIGIDKRLYSKGKHLKTKITSLGTIMIKKTIISTAISTTLMLTFSTIAFASANGFYVGGQLGAANIDNTASSLGADKADITGSTGQIAGPNSVEVDNGDWGGRIYGGYQFNKYLALETGLSAFAPTDVDNLYGTTKNASVNLNAIDAVGKVMLPIGSKVNLFAKGGVSYVMTNHFDGEAYIGQNGYSYSTNEEVDTAWRPTYGLGASVDLTPHLSADVSWSQIVGNDDIPRTNFTALGLAYHFK